METEKHRVIFHSSRNAKISLEREKDNLIFQIELEGCFGLRPSRLQTIYILPGLSSNPSDGKVVCPSKNWRGIVQSERSKLKRTLWQNIDFLWRFSLNRLILPSVYLSHDPTNNFTFCVAGVRTQGSFDQLYLWGCPLYHSAILRFASSWEPP